MKKSTICTIGVLFTIFAMVSDARKYAVDGLSRVNRYLECLEIDRVAQNLEALEGQSELIDAELQQNRALLNQLDMTPAADSVERRIDHLRARSLANTVQIGETVATVDRLAEPAKAVVNHRTEKLGYMTENTTVVAITEPADTPPTITPETETVQPVTVTPTVHVAKPPMASDNCSKKTVYIYQVQAAPTQSRSRCK